MAEPSRDDLRKRLAELECELAELREHVGKGRRYATVQDLVSDLWRWHDEAQAEKLAADKAERELEELREQWRRPRLTFKAWIRALAAIQKEP